MIGAPDDIDQHPETMAGLNKNTPIPTEIKLHQQSKLMEISFADGAHFKLPYEFLRVYSPSAEVRGHGPGQEVLQTGKRNVDITGIEAVGNYAVQPTFSDGHDSRHLLLGPALRSGHQPRVVLAGLPDPARSRGRQPRRRFDHPAAQDRRRLREALTGD